MPCTRRIPRSDLSILSCFIFLVLRSKPVCSFVESLIAKFQPDERILESRKNSHSGASV